MQSKSKRCYILYCRCTNDQARPHAQRECRGGILVVSLRVEESLHVVVDLVWFIELQPVPTLDRHRFTAVATLVEAVRPLWGVKHEAFLCPIQEENWAVRHGEWVRTPRRQGRHLKFRKHQRENGQLPRYSAAASRITSYCDPQNVALSHGYKRQRGKGWEESPSYRHFVQSKGEQVEPKVEVHVKVGVHHSRVNRRNVWEKLPFLLRICSAQFQESM